MAVSHVISQEAILFLQSVAAGGVIWLFYDFLIVFRKVISHNIHVVNLEDFFYWILTGIFICYLIFRSNEGMIRGFSIVGICLGAFFYHDTVSRFVLKGMTCFFLWLKKIICRVFLIIGKLFFWIKPLRKKIKNAKIKKKRKKEQDGNKKKTKKKKIVKTKRKKNKK